MAEPINVSGVEDQFIPAEAELGLRGVWMYNIAADDVSLGLADAADQIVFPLILSYSNLSDSSSPTDAAAEGRNYTPSVSDSVPVSDSASGLLSFYHSTISDTFIPSDDAAKSIVEALIAVPDVSDSIAPSDAASYRVNFTPSISDSFSPADGSLSLRGVWMYNPTGEDASSTLSDLIGVACLEASGIKKQYPNLSDALIYSDTAASLKLGVRTATPSDTVAITEAPLFVTGEYDADFADSITPLDNVQRSLAGIVIPREADCSDAWSTADAANHQLIISGYLPIDAPFSDDTSAAFSETIDLVFSRIGSASDSFLPMDAATATCTLPFEFGESYSSTADSVLWIVGIPKTIDDSIPYDDIVAREKRVVVPDYIPLSYPFGDSFAPDDTCGYDYSWLHSLADSFAPSDAAEHSIINTVQNLEYPGSSDAFSPSDAADRILRCLVPFGEAVPVTDDLFGQRLIVASIGRTTISASKANRLIVSGAAANTLTVAADSATRVRITAVPIG